MLDLHDLVEVDRQPRVGDRDRLGHLLRRHQLPVADRLQLRETRRLDAGFGDRDPAPAPVEPVVAVVVLGDRDRRWGFGAIPATTWSTPSTKRTTTRRSPR